MRWSRILAATLTAALACTNGAAPEVIDPIGCHEIWYAGETPAGFPKQYRLLRLRPDYVDFALHDGDRVAGPWPEDQPPSDMLLFGSWRLVGADSLHIDTGGGSSTGMRFRLKHIPGSSYHGTERPLLSTWEGTAELWTDAPSSRTERVRLATTGSCG